MCLKAMLHTAGLPSEGEESRERCHLLLLFHGVLIRQLFSEVTPEELEADPGGGREDAEQLEEGIHPVSVAPDEIQQTFCQPLAFQGLGPRQGFLFS